VKFSFVSVDGSRTSTILTTQGSAKIRDNFCTVFSAKQADMLVDFTCSGSDWRVTGLFSKPIPNAGMASAERQFLFLNDRPIDFPKITRVCNEMYRRVSHSHPVFVLNIVTPAHNVDVNLTPDKRTVLLHNESEIISTMQAYLKSMFEPTVQSFQVQSNTLDAFSTKTVKSTGSSTTSALTRDVAAEDLDNLPTSDPFCAAAVRKDVIETASSSPSDSVHNGNKDELRMSSLPTVLLPSICATGSLQGPIHIEKNADARTCIASAAGTTKHSTSMAHLELSNGAKSICSDAPAGNRDYVSVDPEHMRNSSPVKSVLGTDGTHQQNISASASDTRQKSCDVESFALIQSSLPTSAGSLFSNFARGSAMLHPPRQLCSMSNHDDTHNPLNPDFATVLKQRGTSSIDSDSENSEANSSSLTSRVHSTRATRRRTSNCESDECSGDLDQNNHRERNSRETSFSKKYKQTSELDCYHDAPQENTVTSEPVVEFLHSSLTIPAMSLSVDWGKLMQQVSSGLGPMNSSGWKMWGASNSDSTNMQSSGSESGNLQQTKVDTNDLSHGTILTDRKIDKADFTRMEVMGQFNKGFIIARLVDDLYIIDQHASDEKCRFEVLQRNTILRTQPLIAPLPLDLSPGDEEILQQRAAIFMKSGFNFRFDDSDRPGRRARLTTVPFSHNVQLGPADVQEMLFLLKDNVDQLCRPSRVTSMFASRACRSAIMIGDPLPLPQMRKV
jgi:DNA mismatch repair protein PMS2